jgi:hypothetical protein
LMRMRIRTRNNLADDGEEGVGPLVHEEGDVVGLEDGAVAVEIVVGGGARLVCGDAGEDGDGENVEVEQEVARHDGSAGGRGHRVVARHPAADGRLIVKQQLL